MIWPYEWCVLCSEFGMVGEKGEKLAKLDLNFKLDNFFFIKVYIFIHLKNHEISSVHLWITKMSSIFSGFIKELWKCCIHRQWPCETSLFRSFWLYLEQILITIFSSIRQLELDINSNKRFHLIFSIHVTFFIAKNLNLWRKQTPKTWTKLFSRRISN